MYKLQLKLKMRLYLIYQNKTRCYCISAVCILSTHITVKQFIYFGNLSIINFFFQGFEHLDPFVPIEVNRYTDKEFMSCASYYRDRLWLRGSPELETELRHTSVNNPYRFMEICAPL